MSFRPAAALGLLLSLVAVSAAQNPTPQTYSRAVPPDKGALDRLNLRTEWSVYLPIEDNRDAIEQVQTFDDQVFVQTRRGLLVTLDARTGRILWSAALGNGGYSVTYPVAVNSQFVFVTNVTRLYAFYRYTGVTEFTMDLGSSPTAGLAADESGVYAVLAIRPGSAGSQRLAVFDLPNPIVIPEVARQGEPRTGVQGQATLNPVDDLTRRYPIDGAYRSMPTETFERSSRASLREAPTGGMTGSRSPSLAVMPRVTPPYTLEGGPFSPALNTLPSLRQPYHLRDESNRYIQRTPSIGTIPPSVAAALALTDLRPHAVAARLRWEYGLTSRVLFTPVLSPQRLWLVTDNRAFLALSKVNKATEVSGPLWEQVAAKPGQAGTLAYVPLADGTLVSVDLQAGNQVGGLNSPWRVNVGGLMNRTPVVTKDSVYAAGDNSGVVRVDRARGDVVWRTDAAADRVLGVNQEFVYVRDRQGRFLVYDALRPTDRATGRTIPLTSLNLPEFNVPVTNTVSDRVYLAADNGLIVCLRDASAKYAAPVRMAPEVTVDPPTKGRVQGLKDKMPPEKKDDTLPEKKAD
jgi:outer membrane protein assembly factor BamB